MYYQKFESVAKISSLFYKPNYIINYFMPSDNPLRQARSRIQQQAFDNSVNKSHISILDMPTGSGKTLCSLKLALESGKEENHIRHTLHKYNRTDR